MHMRRLNTQSSGNQQEKATTLLTELQQSEQSISRTHCPEVTLGCYKAEQVC